jgi:nucleoprotein TPR
MTKTRRKAREDAAHDDEEGSSHAGATTSLPVPVPEDIDLDYLSELLPNIPNLSLVTADAVAVLYKLVVGQNAELDNLRRDVDTLNAEVERRDVELDQALQDKETFSQEMGESMDSVQSDLQQVKQERDKLGLAVHIHKLLPRDSCICVFSWGQQCPQSPNIFVVDVSILVKLSS